MASSVNGGSRGASGVAARKRSALRRGGLVFVVFMAYPVLATLTPVLDGTVAGVSVAYLVGFLEILFGLAVALTHTARAAGSEGS
jgi:uncharacterized membrane protein (DUF485 family)